MEKKNKKLDVLQTKSLSILVEELNKIGVQKEDLVGIYSPNDFREEWKAVFYY